MEFSDLSLLWNAWVYVERHPGLDEWGTSVHAEEKETGGVLLNWERPPQGNQHHRALRTARCEVSIHQVRVQLVISPPYGLDEKAAPRLVAIHLPRLIGMRNLL